MGLVEEWKVLPGFLNYEVSTKGRIRSMDRSVNHFKGGFALKKGKLRAPTVSNSGYLLVRLWVDGKGKNFLIHRLVALAFIPNDGNKPCVNHIDGIKTNNTVENLEWASYSDNIIHAHANGLCKKTRSSAKFGLHFKKRIRAVNIQTNKEIIFDSINECSTNLGISRSRISLRLNKGGLIKKIYQLFFV